MAVLAAGVALYGGAYLVALMLKWEPIEARSDILLSEADARAYHVDGERTLIAWRGQWFVISRRAPIVVRPSNYYGRFLGRDWWHRDSYAGVIVGDRVKDDEESCQRFEGRNVIIRRPLGTLKIEFPDEIDPKLLKGAKGPWICSDESAF